MNHQTIKPRARPFNHPEYGRVIRVWSKLGWGYGYTLDKALRAYHTSVRMRANSDLRRIIKELP